MLNRRQRIVSALLVFSLTFVFSPAMGGTPSEDVSRQLLEYRFTTRDITMLNERIAQAHAELIRRAEEAPTQGTKALIILARPLNGNGVTDLAERYNLEVTAVRHATITRDRTFGGEFAALDWYAGTLGDKLDLRTNQLLVSIDAVINGRLPFQSHPEESGFTASAISDAVQAFAERKQQILSHGLMFYEMHAVGALTDLAFLLQVEPDIAAVRLVEPAPVPEWMVEEMKERFPDGMPKIPLDAFPLALFQPQSGQFGARVFSNSSGHQAMQQGEAGFVCGPDSGNANEQNCPPDQTFAPARPEDGGGRYFQAVMQPFVWGSLGWATAGGFQTWVQWSTHTDGGIVLNTAAFKEASLPHCNPSYNGTAAPCANPDSVFVSQAAYESELLIPNPTCLLPVRSGTIYDIFGGCFLGLDHDSSFPGINYQDTTFLDTIPDDPHPHGDGTNPYNAALGVFQADQLSSGMLYHTWIGALTLGMNGPEQVSGKVVRLSGQIGTSNTIVPCVPGQETFCVFSVDTTKLAEATFP